MPADRRLGARAEAKIAASNYHEAELYLDAAQSINPDNSTIHRWRARLSPRPRIVEWRSRARGRVLLQKHVRPVV